MDENSKLIQQIADRARRTETRVTMIANHLGVEVGGDKPKWRPDGQVDVPSRMCSVKELMVAVPFTWPSGKPVSVYVCDSSGSRDFLMTITV